MKSPRYLNLYRTILLPGIILVCTMISCNPSLPDSIKEVYGSLPEKVDYNFHIKPILADRCYACHGPDENSRKGNLRLDVEADAFA